MTNRERSIRSFERAQQVLVGGVNSPVRAFKGVGGTPLFIERGSGAAIWDMDGNEYVDYVLSYGPLILGHAHPQVAKDLTKAVRRGTSFGAPTDLEIDLAEAIQRRLPGMERIRFVNSGTEATMSALRLARAFTGRNKILKFRGCYHGHADLLLVQAGSGVATLGLPDSPGVPAAAVADTLLAPYNDLAAVRSLFAAEGPDIAAVIVEPVAGNMGVVPPVDGFLAGLQKLCQTHAALLVFDEVMTGFRVDPAGAQALYRVEPDLTVLGKVIGGGLPVGAFGGRADIMAMLAPEGPVYQAGTLSGNPLAMRAGLTTLEILSGGGVWELAEAAAASLQAGLDEIAVESGIPAVSTRVGTMLSFFFLDQVPTSWEAVQEADVVRYGRFFHGMLDAGVYLAPSQFEAAFLSTEHSPDVIDRTLAAARTALDSVS